MGNHQRKRVSGWKITAGAKSDRATKNRGNKPASRPFDFAQGSTSSAGNQSAEGRFRELVAAITGFFHELTHDFTNASGSRASRYSSINSAMSEAFATYLAYYFERTVLRYSAADIAAAEKFAN